MPSTVQRIVGATAFAILLTLVMSATPLLEGNLDAGRLLGSLLAAWLVAYVAWPGVEEAWANRDPANNGRRLVWIGLGVLVAILLGQAVNVFAGPDRPFWSFVLVIALLAALMATIVIQVRRTGRS